MLSGVLSNPAWVLPSVPTASPLAHWVRSAHDQDKKSLPHPEFVPQARLRVH